MVLFRASIPAELMTTRAFQIIITCFIAMFLAQILKVIIYSIRHKRFMGRMFFTTGGLPSSHSALCVCLCIILGMLQYHDENQLTWAFAVSVVLASVVLYDAMGIRLEASKHAKILNKLAEDMTEEEQIKLLDLKFAILDYAQKYKSGYSCIGQIQDFIRYKFKDTFNI